jgi:TolB-like protein/DNA-binding winged helix-turn-helix (wHTH) protein/Flp pilus assembly protein TadD
MADLSFEPQSIRFGDFELVVGSGELRKSGGDPVLLPEQPFRILITLISRSGNVVTRDELRRELWPDDTFVDFEQSLNAAIKRLRTALGDSATDPRFIQTIPRRGYRFIASSETINSPSPVEPAAAVLENESVGKGHMPRWWLPVGGLAVLAIAAMAYVISQSGRMEATPPEIRSIAVLPLRNLSGDPTQEYLADALTEALTHSLGQIQALSVVSTTSAVRFKGSDQPLPEIAKQLKVDAFIEGSIQRENNRLRIIVQLVHAMSDRQIWTQAFERELTDIFTLQKDVARAIAAEIRIRLTPEEQTRMASAASVNTEAYEAYLKGRYHLLKELVQDLEPARVHFERAIQMDPAYAPAYAGLSYTLRQLAGFGAQQLKEVEAPARAAAQKALDLDDRLAEAHVAQGHLKLVYDWDWKGGENSFIRAIELDQNSLDAHFLYARLLMASGRFPEAIAKVQRAERLAPVSSAVQVLFASILYRAAQPDEAIAHLNSAIELEPQKPMTYQILGEVYEQVGRYADAISTHEKARDLRTLTFAGKPGFNSAIARVYARTGRKSDARRILKTLQDTASHPYEVGASVASAYAALDDKNEAFRLLFKLAERKADYTVKTDPRFASLHSDSRWRELLALMNLSESSPSR